ncbi:MAG: hypothetical protein N3D82_03120 [Ignisphaera sp.]|nr:hypothetical protein [Ignisphaera sp.]MCX8168003.1 hypothetical protein [Ignisphaera sp.]MDW8085526.1 hypothetical protein [Ignisphaera sp.]
MSITIEPKILALYPSAKDFADVIDTVGKIVDEVLIYVDPHGFKIRALDPSRIAMLSINLPPEAFQEYSVSEEVGVGLAVSVLSRILKQLKKSDRITIAANNEYVEILIEGMSVRRYKFKNLEVIAEEAPELTAHYDVEASILSSPLRATLSELASICSTIGIAAKEDTLTFFDYDTRKSTYRLTTAAGTIINLNVKREASAAYDSGYVSKIVEVLKLSNLIELKYGAEAPLHLSMEFAGGRIEYLIAPKI